MVYSPIYRLTCGDVGDRVGMCERETTRDKVFLRLVVLAVEDLDEAWLQFRDDRCVPCCNTVLSSNTWYNN